MTNNLHKDAAKLRNDLALFEDRMGDLKLELEAMTRDRAKLWITIDLTREKLKHVEKMIERDDDEHR